MTPNLCIVCNGKGTVSKAFYNNVELLNMQTSFVLCRACSGSGILWAKTKAEEMEDNDYMTGYIDRRKKFERERRTDLEKKEQLNSILNKIKETAEENQKLNINKTKG